MLLDPASTELHLRETASGKAAGFEPACDIGYSVPMNTSVKTDHQRVRVNDREQLIYLLTEAAEIEHGLMCCYLYAGWSLKQGQAEQLTSAQAAAVERWRSEIRSVAMEEMAHLATVNNLLISIGAPPHFGRQNFPVPPGYHPASMVVRLAPLTRATLAHFVYLERPEGMEMEPAPGFEPARTYRRQPYHTRLTPTAEDFDTVSHLYRGIQQGFVTLAERLGETALFVGQPSAQITPDIMDLPGLASVHDLVSAMAAIELIIEQGEGGRFDAEQSHFLRFTAMAEEYDGFLQTDPGFTACRAVVADPIMFAPLGDAVGQHISAQLSAMVLDAGNATYGLMLRLLASATSDAGDGAGRQVEIDSAVELMHVIHRLGVALTELPAVEGGSVHAGLNFHLPRSNLALPQREAGAALLAERAHEIALALGALARQCPQVDGSLAEKVSGVGQNLIAIQRGV